MKRFAIVLPIFLLFSSDLLAKNDPSQLLDRIVAVFNDRVISLSEIQRIKSILTQRRQVAREIFPESLKSDEEIITNYIESLVIREGLKELGYVIDDERVEFQVRSREKQLGLNRDQLVEQLKLYQLSFEEYFEIIRRNDEYGVFYEKIIAPLISITDQEIKNEFISRNSENTSISYRYMVIDYFLSSEQMPKSNLETFVSDVSQYRQNGNLPSHLRDLQTVDLGELTEEGLSSGISKALKSTLEGELSSPILFNNEYHVFFIQKKEIVESNYFKEAKDKIRQQLFERLSTQAATSWVAREKNKHFIKLL